MRIHALGPFALAMLTSSCSLFTGPESCHDPLVEAAVKVEVTDGLSGEYLALQATGSVVRGEYVETMHRAPGFAEDRYLFADGNGPGTYQVFVEAEGYQPWSATGKAVAEGCGGLRGADLEAKLVKE